MGEGGGVSQICTPRLALGTAGVRQEGDGRGWGAVWAILERGGSSCRGRKRVDWADCKGVVGWGGNVDGVEAPVEEGDWWGWKWWEGLEGKGCVCEDVALYWEK